MDRSGTAYVETRGHGDEGRPLAPDRHTPDARVRVAGADDRGVRADPTVAVEAPTRADDAMPSAGRQLVGAIVFAGVAVLVALLGLAAVAGGGDWYDDQERPGLALDSSILTVAWAGALAVAAVAGWLAWRRATAAASTVLWALQMVLVVAWFLAMFSAESPGSAVLVNTALLFVAFATAMSATRASLIGGLLAFAFAWWLAFVFVLSVGVGAAGR